jgi:tetratricopeptide (TPR) repeat protein
MKRNVAKWLVAGAVGLGLAAVSPQSGFSAGDPPPQPKECGPGKSCKSQTRDDEIYSLGYWQAKSGQYEAALATLGSAKAQSDPRIQTMIGFSLRKLGRVDEAMAYYTTALASRPGLTSTRQYLGEAFLQKGEPAKAKEQLAEIAKRCGVACEDYRLLADEIAKFEKAS